MPYILCKVDDGLRPSEVTVEIGAIGGRSEFLRVDRDFVKEFKGCHYLPIGLVFKNKTENKQIALIELPHEADSGANRLWVASSSLLEVESNGREASNDSV